MTEAILNLPTVLIPSASVRPKTGPPTPTQAVNLPSFETLDRVGRSMIARLTAGVSPHAEAAAWLDWLSHFSRAPGRQLELAALGTVLTARLATLMAGIPVAPSLEPEPIDHRFSHPGWKTFRFSGGSRSFLRRKSGGAAPRDRFAERRPGTLNGSAS